VDGFGGLDAVYGFLAPARAAAPYVSKSDGLQWGSINALLFRNDMPEAPLSAASKGALVMQFAAFHCTSESLVKQSIA
jgi:hypothetical protein